VGERDPIHQGEQVEGQDPFSRGWSWCRVHATTSYLVYAITDDRQNVFAKTKSENCVAVRVLVITVHSNGKNY
jgi:hypothetical protein